MKIKSEGKEEDGDLFLVDKVFPVVLEVINKKYYIFSHLFLFI